MPAFSILKFRPVVEPALGSGTKAGDGIAVDAGTAREAGDDLGTCFPGGRNWLESRSEWRVAIALYEHGVAQQMLAEPIYYRGLMHCHLALGKHAEALIVYRRCRDLLSRVLGVMPGAETNRIHERLVAAAARPRT